MLDWQPFVIAGGVAAFLIAFPKVRRGVREVWEVTALIVTRGRRLVKMHHMVSEIYNYTLPNGTPLPAKLEQISREHAEMREDVAELKNMFQAHIMDRKPGGQRGSDPE